MSAGETHEHSLGWMSPFAPYAPVATVGLLAVLGAEDPGATAHWAAEDGGRPHLVMRSRLGLEEIAAAIAAAPWPHLDVLPWKAKRSQAIKPTLEATAKGSESNLAAVTEWHALAGLNETNTPAEGDLRTAQELIAALLTDAALDGGGVPGRNRLLRGVKADLSGVAKPPKVDQAELLNELQGGPIWRSGSSGLGLGFVPQVQTFGGTTGPEPSSIGAYSALLYFLCWHGIIAMPPFGVRRGLRTVVGGPLFAAGDVLSWATWSMPLRRRGLIALFGLAAIHDREPDPRLLEAHGIKGVFRSTARQINSMISVFGWAERII